MIEIGLVGKPSSGKSSFFKAATMIDVKTSPVPFTTIEPNTGIAYVTVDCVEKEFNVRCSPKTGHCKNGKRFIPVKLIDVGGLIPGSHEGRGLGNQFLDNLRQASVLIQVVDTSGTTDSEGKPAIGYDPAEEVGFLEKEVDLWFAGIIEKAIKKIGVKATMGSKDELVKMLAEQLSGLGVTKTHIEYALDETGVSDIEKFAHVIRKISKPILIAANKIDLESSQENFEKLKEKFNETIIVPSSAESEIALKKAAEKNLIEYDDGDSFVVKGDLESRQAQALNFIKNNVIEKYGSTGIKSCLNKAAFDLLNYIVVYPVANSNKLSDSSGNVLPDAFLIPKSTTLKDLAFKIHTDIGEKFIGGIDARSKKKLGGDHIIENRDVVEILFKR